MSGSNSHTAHQCYVSFLIICSVTNTTSLCHPLWWLHIHYVVWSPTHNNPTHMCMHMHTHSPTQCQCADNDYWKCLGSPRVLPATISTILSNISWVDARIDLGMRIVAHTWLIILKELNINFQSFASCFIISNSYIASV